jgi:hypothetical protein
MRSENRFGLGYWVRSAKKRTLIILSVVLCASYAILFTYLWIRAKGSWEHTFAFGYGVILIAALIILLVRIRLHSD